MNPRGKILLVEDNTDDVEMILAALAKNNLANEVVVARHGGEALDYLHRRGEFHSRPPDYPVVVLLDLKMPKVGGLEVLRQMKSDDELKIIPVVILTSSLEEADLARSYELGANSFMVKPGALDQLVESIRVCLDFWNRCSMPPL